jgi:hypothetical protein
MQAAYQIMPKEHPIWAAAPRVVVSSSNVRHVVDSLKALGVDLVKSRNVWGADFLALADATQEAGLPLASHNPNRVNMVDAARHGLDSFEHAESIWGDFDTLTVEAREAMFAEVARTTAMVTPTLMADIGLVVSSDSAILAIVADTMGRLDARNLSLPPRMRHGWMEAVESRRKYGEHPPGTFAKITRDVQAMHRAGIAMMAGTDVGGIPLVFPGTSLHEELELLVREGGLTPLARARRATRRGSSGARRSSAPSRRVASRTWCCWTRTPSSTSATPARSRAWCSTGAGSTATRCTTRSRRSRRRWRASGLDERPRPRDPTRYCARARTTPSSGAVTAAARTSIR